MRTPEQSTWAWGWAPAGSMLWSIFARFSADLVWEEEAWSHLRMRTHSGLTSWNMATQAKQAKTDGKNNHEAGDEQAGKCLLLLLMVVENI